MSSTFWTGLLATLCLVAIFVLALRHVVIPTVLPDVLVGIVVGHFAVQLPTSKGTP
jgi:hypothetical protein